MKKYLKLTAREAISHFILGDETLAPEASEEIKQKISDLHKLDGEICVTVTIPTHRTKPDYLADPIALKNRIDEAEKQLYSLYDKRAVWPVAENLREAQQAVDMGLNLDSMVVYANEHFSSVVKLPVDLEESCSVGRYFDLTPLYRTMQQNREYYIITVSKNLIRVVEALNDKALTEVEIGDFPFAKNSFYEVKWDRPAADGFGDSMEKEFYNDADKSFRAIYNDNPLPVVLAGDVKSVSYYEEQMDDKRMVIARVAGSFDQASLHEIVKAVQPEVAKYRDTTRRAYLKRIDDAASAELLVTDIREIIEKARNGAAEALFVGESFSFAGDPALDSRTGKEKSEFRSKIDDMYSEIMRDVTHNGGSIIFMEDGDLARYGGIVMTARYKTEG